jgi:hypothetical protein
VANVYTITYTASDKAGNVAHATRTINVGVSFTRADYLWSYSTTSAPYGYTQHDSDVTTHTNNGDNTGCSIVAGVGANDVNIGCFWYSPGQYLYTTVNGASITVTGTQNFSAYSSKFSGSGTLNSSKNKITLNLHDANDGHDHIITLTK